MAVQKSQDKLLREHVLYLLTGGSAHASFDDAVKGMPEKLRGVKPEGLPHSAWMLLEHLRLAQWDILEFSRNAKHKSPSGPRVIGPRWKLRLVRAAWDKSIQQFHDDLKAMKELVENPKTDLYAPLPWGDGKLSCARPCSSPTTMPTTWRS